MANRHTPNGGVEYGAGAQEEYLFRSSNYYQTLHPMQSLYPMDWNYEDMYSSKVTVFRGLEDNGYPFLENPFNCAFVAVAAINNPDVNFLGKYTESSKEATLNKIRTMLNIGILNGHKTLILSAFGCGVFHNPCDQMVALFKQVLEEEPYKYAFEKVYFSIKPNHRDTKNENFKTFNKLFS